MLTITCFKFKLIQTSNMSSWLIVQQTPSQVTLNIILASLQLLWSKSQPVAISNFVLVEFLLSFLCTFETSVTLQPRPSSCLSLLSAGWQAWATTPVSYSAWDVYSSTNLSLSPLGKAQVHFKLWKQMWERKEWLFLNRLVLSQTSKAEGSREREQWRVWATGTVTVTRRL